MADSTIPELELDGRNWKAYRESLLKAAATKGWLGILSGQEPSDETLRWEGKDAQVKMLLYRTVPVPLVLKFRRLKTSHEMFDYLATTFRDPTPISLPIKKPVEASSDDETRELLAKPSELSVEPPVKERLENGLTEARSKDGAEAAFGAAQQVSPRSVKVKEYLPELHEQLSSRAVEPLESEHIEVLEGMVEKPVEVEKPVKVEKPVEVQDIDRKAMRHGRLIEEWRESAMVHIRDIPDDLPIPQPDTPPSIKLEGEWTEDPSFDVELTSGIENSYNQTMNSQSFPTEDPNLTVYDPGGILRQPAAHNEQANEDQVASDGGGKNIEPHHVETEWIPMMGVLLEGEQTRSTSSNETNPRGYADTSSPLSICTDRLSEPTTTWRQVGMGDINVTTPRNAPVEAPITPHQEITFAQPASPDEGPTARDVKSEIVTGSHGKLREGKVDTTTSDGVNLERDEGAMLAGECQDACQDKNLRGDLPTSSQTSTTCRKCSYEVHRPKCRRGRSKFKARNVSRRREDKEAYRSCDNATSHAREGIGTPQNLTIEAWTLQECPDGVRNWNNVNTNVPSRSRGPGGQDEANEAFGDVEGKPKLRNDAGGVKMDGRRCQMDGATSSMCCSSKRAETKLLAEDEACQHQWQQYRPRNVPGPPTRLPKRSYEVTKPKRRRGRIKTESRKVSRLQEGENMYQECANTIAHPREGIGTPQSLTTVSGTQAECQRCVRGDAGGVQALRSTKTRCAGHEHDTTYHIGQLRSRTVQGIALEAQEQIITRPLSDRNARF
ncbi:hypothetical protein PISMIDRAFT_12202 [Pisolithus microcarpus 441]|uniref:Uncharacterized protein n=1 Tax=Pisolithus microcarpus 441 TaxID=765257 RepID=A0A0C9ZGG6_9AGAM|nr:hypothetical protein BKA83DRAFT_12202 [Pisolithus microcarpus]KIK21577.1 hypothetical protein PISMIDRAFT_12202 [Pisolithus microcarpus 441]